MYKTFNEEPTRPYRALQLWQILIAKAANRQVATYGELERLIGFKGAGVFAQTLGHIMYYCQQNGLPPLTALVVKKKTGLPGHGLTVRKDLDAGREEAFGCEWFKVLPPTPRQLGDAYRKGHSRKPQP
jgi:hypothetical protein